MTNRWTLPEALAVLEVKMADGARVYVRRHGNPDGPRMILSHGNGLSADTYYPYWSLLAARFDLFIYDIRNHGWNPIGNQRSHHIPSFAQDCEGVVRAIRRNFEEKPAVGVFHSMSTLPALLYAQGWSGASAENMFSALVLFDPAICTPSVLLEDMYQVSDQMHDVIKRRRTWFENREAFVSRYRDAPAFKRLLPGVVDLMAETTLRPVPDGEGYALRCPREYEAQVAQFFFGWVLQLDLGNVRCPVKAIGADPTRPHAFLPSVDLGTLTDLDYDFLPEATHFLQLEKPEQCVALTIDFLERRQLI